MRLTPEEKRLLEKLAQKLGGSRTAVMEMAVRCCSGFVLEVCHQHGGSFKVEHTIAACLKLLQRRWIDINRRF